MTEACKRLSHSPADENLNALSTSPVPALGIEALEKLGSEGDAVGHHAVARHIEDGCVRIVVHGDD